MVSPRADTHAKRDRAEYTTCDTVSPGLPEEWAFSMSFPFAWAEESTRCGISAWVPAYAGMTKWVTPAKAGCYNSTRGCLSARAGPPQAGSQKYLPNRVMMVPSASTQTRFAHSKVLCLLHKKTVPICLDLA